jgi:hypothetical protein
MAPIGHEARLFGLEVSAAGVAEDATRGWTSEPVKE